MVYFALRDIPVYKLGGMTVFLEKGFAIKKILDQNVIGFFIINANEIELLLSLLIEVYLLVSLSWIGNQNDHHFEESDWVSVDEGNAINLHHLLPSRKDGFKS